MQGELTIAWADGRYTFRLSMTDILELEEKCKCGIRGIIRRVIDDDYHYNDVRETIRLALITGGLKPTQALTLVERYVDARPSGFAESAIMAQLILSSILVPFIDHPLADATTEEGTAAPTIPAPPTIPTSASMPPPSMPPPDELDYLLGNFDQFRAGNGPR